MTASEWLPIESAPAGEWVLLWTPPEPGWDYEEEPFLAATTNLQWVGKKDERGYWGGYYSGTQPHGPTHWKPLGPPPASQLEQE